MPPRSTSPRDPRTHVVRRLAPGNLAIGAVATAGAVAMLRLFWGLHRIPRIALPLAGIMLLGGLYLLARPFADACAACGRTLVFRTIRRSSEALAEATTFLRSMEVSRALEVLARSGTSSDARADLRYCRSCGGAAVWKGDGVSVVLGGDDARTLVAALVPADPAADAPE